MSAATPSRTPLYHNHLESGGRMVEFAGWEMPVQYSGLIEEHRAVRGAAGLFDVSHMGEFRVSGSGAEAFLQHLTPNDVIRLTPGRAHYTGLLNEAGGYIDDLLVYRLAAEEFLVVVNAANVAKDFAWIQEHAAGFEGVGVENVSDRYALLALQGPAAPGILAPLIDDSTGEGLSAIRYYGFMPGRVSGKEALISRTGYTGEDGFELYVAPEDAPGLWRDLLAAGGEAGIKPAGLGARDSLRLEAGMALYGHELDATTTPWEASLDWVVKLDQGPFIGRQALVTQRLAGAGRKLCGFEVLGRGIARQGHVVLAGGEAVGKVTSGSWSPTLDKAIGMAYFPADLATPGTRVMVDIRGREVEAEIVALPFYRRPKSKSG